MKLGLVTYNVAKDWSLDTLIEMCVTTGIEGVELRTTHAHGVEIGLSDAERAAVRRKFENSGVTLWCLGSVCQYHEADPQVVRRNIEETKEWVKLAAEVGAEGVKVRPNGFVEGVAHEVTLRQIGEALIECGEFADENDVQIMLEVHGSGTCIPSNIKAVMDVCDHPSVGLTWNCNAADMDENGSITDNFNLLATRIVSAHIHDLYEDYPYGEFIDLMAGIDFDGFCLIEMPESCEPERLLSYYALLWDAWTA